MAGGCGKATQEDDMSGPGGGWAGLGGGAQELGLPWVPRVRRRGPGVGTELWSQALASINVIWKTGSAQPPLVPGVVKPQQDMGSLQLRIKSQIHTRVLTPPPFTSALISPLSIPHAGLTLLQTHQAPSDLWAFAQNLFPLTVCMAPSLDSFRPPLKGHLTNQPSLIPLCKKAPNLSLPAFPLALTTPGPISMTCL